jgi:hypothetical protein
MFVKLYLLKPNTPLDSKECRTCLILNNKYNNLLIWANEVKWKSLLAGAGNDKCLV